MNFVDYPSNIFSSVSSNGQVILTADTNVVWLNSLIICNRVNNTLRFNLQKKRVSTTNTEIYLINELAIQPYQTLDIVEHLGLRVFLQYQNDPALSDSLECFSGHYSQIFDCEVCYSKLNELPDQTNFTNNI